MHSAFVGGICRIGIFIICAQVLVHFRADVSYEKYLKMLVSVMILLQVLQPVSGLLKGEQGRNLQEHVAWFEQQMRESMEAAARSREEAEQLREQMSLEEVRRRLREAAESAEGEAGEENRQGNRDGANREAEAESKAGTENRAEEENKAGTENGIEEGSKAGTENKAAGSEAESDTEKYAIKVEGIAPIEDIRIETEGRR